MMGRVKIVRDLGGGRFRVADESGAESDVDASDLVPVEDAGPIPPAPSPQSEVEFLQYELEGGIVTINELRASKGLARDERFGDMTLPEYKAANADTYKLATLATSAGGGEIVADGVSE